MTYKKIEEEREKQIKTIISVIKENKNPIEIREISNKTGFSCQRIFAYLNNSVKKGFIHRDIVSTGKIIESTYPYWIRTKNETKRRNSYTRRFIW